MKAIILGNMSSVGYNYALILRRLGVDCHLAVVTEQRGTQCDPKNENPDLVEPDWIVEISGKRLRRDPLYFAAWVKKLGKFDVVWTMGVFPILAQFAKSPQIICSTGADLKEVVFEKGLRGHLMRRAYRTCGKAYYMNVDQIPAMERLGWEMDFLPFAVDTDLYAPGQANRADMRANMDKFVFLHCSLLDWANIEGRVTSKRNDLFFRAFARFAEKRDDLELIILAAGYDVEATRQLIRDLDLDRCTRFLPFQTKPQLLQLYKDCDVVVDQFGMPKFGVNAVEAMSVGKPVMVALDEAGCEQAYGDVPPILNCRSEQEIEQRLNSLGDRQTLAETGRQCRDWVIRHHAFEKVGNQLLNDALKVLGAPA